MVLWKQMQSCQATREPTSDVAHYRSSRREADGTVRHNLSLCAQTITHTHTHTYTHEKYATGLDQQVNALNLSSAATGHIEGIEQ